MIDGRSSGQVVVRGHRYTVEVWCKSEGVWVAGGEYEGEVLAAEASSREAAVKRWREMAEHQDEAQR
jgi:hypothetical protein